MSTLISHGNRPIALYHQFGRAGSLRTDRPTYEYTSWQANDPLVHYMQSDLNFTGADPQNGSSGIQTGVNKMAITTTSFALAARSRPCECPLPAVGQAAPTVGTGISQRNYDTNPFNLAFKDPLMTQSDNWDFPTNKYPTVGWLGRVHRGTPWQTVYLKAHNILNEIKSRESSVGTNTWAQWTWATLDWNLRPIFRRRQHRAGAGPPVVRSCSPRRSMTTPRAAQLSVNVAANPNDPASGLAAWSALFSGMVALTNMRQPSVPQLGLLRNTISGPVTIQTAGPAGMNSTLGKLVQGINDTRTNL